MKGNNQKDAGFTLVEVIVAMVIMMIGVIPLLSLFGSSLNNYDRSTKTTVALNIAEEKLEVLGEEDLSTQIGITGWEEIASSPGYEYQIEVKDVSYEVNGQEVELYTIQVKVRWDSPKGLQEISLRNNSTGRQDDADEG